MKAFDKIATCHYRESRAAFYDNIIRTPMLIFGSKIDPVATEDTLRTLKNYWEKNGLKVILYMEFLVTLVELRILGILEDLG